MSHLKVENLEKSYGENKILHGISFDVGVGEFISLLGPSGCGKTTTLRCIAGLERPDPGSGTIKLGTAILSGGGVFMGPERRHFGMVFQSYAVWPHMNVFDNVAFPLTLSRPRHQGQIPIASKYQPTPSADTRQTPAKLTKEEIKKRVDETLKLVHLNGLESRYGHELSGGQQQRVALARALVMSPDLLLLDEPLSNLDVLLREELRVEIQRIQRKLKLTTILVTHDQREALSLSDRIIVMNKGHIEANDTPQNLYSRPTTPFVTEFLLGGQAVTLASGEKEIFVPRRWRLGSGSGRPAKIISRLYLGNEYEYWGEIHDFVEPVKFYSDRPLDLSSTVNLEYQNL